MASATNPWDPQRVRRALLRWYDAHARPLPWRATRDPYAIWVSEIMCQQTRVDTAIPYYERFLARFPSVADLAAASEDEVLGVWSGLGYYRRARLLHRGAREVVARYGGQVPRDAQARLALPGVGRYTAGAIGSIAFGAREPVVDGNVARVLARLRRIETPLGRAVTERALWADAAALVDGPRPGALNQALMELGALVCTPSAPACPRCPVERWCAGRPIAETLPVPRPKTRARRLELVAVVATRARPLRVWLERRDGELFGGLWSVPMREAGGADLGTEARHALRAAGIRARLPQTPRGELTHLLSHRRLHLRVFRATGAAATPHADLALVEVERLAEDRGVSTLTRKILDVALR